MRAQPFFLVLLALLNMGMAQPTDPDEEKKRIDADLAEAGALLETASGNARAALFRLAELNQSVAVARQRAVQAHGAAAAAEYQVATAQRVAQERRRVAEEASRRYAIAAERVQEGRTRLGRFATATYQGGDVAEFNALIAGDGLAQLAQRMGYAQQLAESKEEAMSQLLGALWDAKQVSNEASLARRSADAAVTAAQAAAAQAIRTRDEAETAARTVLTAATQQQQAVAAAEAYRLKMLERHAAAKRESERFAAERAAAQARAAARLLMPVNGRKSSNFGQRFHPRYHVWRLHAGIDFAAGAGAPIYAAADGRVTSAGWRGGYGRYTCLAHGGYEGRALSTCYAHQSRILVRNGQWVSRGQLIGRVGTTGVSTGNHLHFEVRLNGTPTNPADWLPSCLC